MIITDARNGWQRVLVTEYVGVTRFDRRTVYSFEKHGSVWFAKKRHGHTVVIDEVRV